MEIPAMLETGRAGAAPVADAPCGAISGLRVEGVQQYLGIPYGTARRFETAEPCPPFTAPYRAEARGPRCPQIRRMAQGDWLNFLNDPTPTGEDCLVLNVFAPDIPATGKRPVMVWLHGGGYISGSGGSPGADGSHLAARGDVVVVSLNHRLNAFGFTYLPEIVPGHTGVNTGMTDIVLALKWVRDNVAAFGGDPGNVTIFGQSGGGSKVAILMAMPSAEGLFHRAVVQSASSLLRMATPERATRCARLLLEELGIDDPTPEALSAADPETVLQARLRAVARNDGIDDFRPVVDPGTLPANPFEPASLARSAHIPLMIGTCEDEMSFFLAAAGVDFDRIDMDMARARFAGFSRASPDLAGAVLDNIRAGHPDELPSQILVRALSEQMYRRNDREAADLRTAAGGAPVWTYLFRWKTAALDGHLKSPHTMCIPFIFGSVAAAAPLLGRPEQARALADSVMDTWLAFARTGDPNHAGLPDWPVHETTTRPTMIFDDECHVAMDPLPETRKAIAACPAYSTDSGAATLGAAV
ncbi:carboxylesterase family protein [Pseudooceanicola sp. 216_PA32_1]|uniref:Carboxylic ester hydrolase n=1 Tax=Pseudooceanicola pacificus TaxID=2676438 RepID=A0A844WEU5_9RHOB|nr:carboxylesterase family protein [Pseudooceanicola pacificus]MWB79362.1 carboxylesterase family protein [Pseudooceanicola pacificus]